MPKLTPVAFAFCCLSLGCITLFPADDESGSKEIFPLPPNPLPSDTLPLEFTAVYIEQLPPSAGDAAAGYTGSIGMCSRLKNPNDYHVYKVNGFAFYLVHATPNGEMMTLVFQEESLHVGVWYAHLDYRNGVPYHFIHANETAEGGGSTRYAIHTWAEVLTLKDPQETREEYELTREDYVSLDPPLREELWFNVTFTPYHSGGLHKYGDRDCLGGDIYDNSTRAASEENAGRPGSPSASGGKEE